MRKKYVCLSKDCRRVAELEIPAFTSSKEFRNPRCKCGSEMKKVYTKPTFAKLSMVEAVQQFGELVGEEAMGRR